MATLVNKKNVNVRLTAPKIDTESCFIPLKKDAKLWFSPKEWYLLEDEPIDLDAEVKKWRESHGFPEYIKELTCCAKYFFELGKGGCK